jgi:CDP-diacylglycerol--glycerol-3-phosphate 3-phosphatidyltransferase
MNIATTKGQSKGQSRSLSLPNILTYARIAAIPVVVGCVYAQSVMDGPLWLRWVALAVFIAAGVTDVLDGYYARMWDQQSAFGRMLDPIADKLLVASCLLMLAADNSIHGWTLWAAIVILCREILVSGLREYLAALRVSVPVTKLAKWKTTIQLVAIGFLIAGEAGEQILSATTLIGIVLLWMSAIFTIYTGWDYFRPASITSSRRMRDEGQIFRLGARADRYGRGNGRAAGQCAHGGRSDRLALGARRGLRLCVREAEGDPRRDRPHPCQAGCRLPAPARLHSFRR